MLATPWDPRWIQIGAASDTVRWSDTPVTVSRFELAGPNTFLDVFRLYWINGHVTSSDYVAKALMAWSKITGQGDDSALIVIYAAEPGRGKGASDTLQKFVAANSPSIEQTLATAQRGQR
jgi:EpsI family protein